MDPMSYLLFVVHWSIIKLKGWDAHEFNLSRLKCKFGTTPPIHMNIWLSRLKFRQLSVCLRCSSGMDE